VTKHEIYASLHALMGRDLSVRERDMIDALYPPQELVRQQGHQCVNRTGLSDYTSAPGTTYDVWAHHISATRH
jgi:hypothetical protein